MSDPTFQVVLRALDQKKGVDLLDAPRVTTKSGQRAVIEIVREFRYPTEFDPPQIPQNFGGSGSGGSATTAIRSSRSRPTTPTAFETRNTGVTLEVEPTVGSDNYTIDLNLVPQVVEFEGFINYGSPISTINPAVPRARAASPPPSPMRPRPWSSRRTSSTSRSSRPARSPPASPCGMARPSSSAA